MKLAHGQSTSRHREHGVTLIELMVVVAVVAILAAIALPNYRSYVLRSNRAEAKHSLMQLAAAQERFYLQNNAYTAKLTDVPPTGLGLSATSENGLYKIEIKSADKNGFAATATATGTQAADTHCAEFKLDQTGSKTATSADCWAR